MKKLFPFLLALLIALPAYGGTKATALTADTAPAATDIIAFVKDPGGSKLDRYLTFGNLTKALTIANFPASANVVTMLGSANNAAILSNIGAQAAGSYQADIGLTAKSDSTSTTSSTTAASSTAVKAAYDLANGKQAADADLTSLAGGLTGPIKGLGNGNGYSALAYGDIVGLWTTCTGYLKSDGTCDTPAGGGDLLADGTVPLTANWDVGAFTITAAGFTAAKTSGVAGLNSLYESATTSTKYIGWMGPTTLNPSESWSYQLKETPPSAGGIMVFAAPTGTGDPNGNKVSAQSWLQPGTGVATALAVNVGSAGAPVVFNGALGTPSSGTLTNATGLPIAGLTASTSTALGVGSIELGHASDTTLSRSAGGVMAVEGKVVPRIIVSGTKALATSEIASGACTAAQDAGTATGVATTDIIDWGFNADPTGITGFGPAATGGLFIYAYPTADHVNIKVCNNTAGAITPGAMTINWRITR